MHDELSTVAAWAWTPFDEMNSCPSRLIQPPPQNYKPGEKVGQLRAYDLSANQLGVVAWFYFPTDADIALLSRYLPSADSRLPDWSDIRATLIAAGTPPSEVERLTVKDVLAIAAASIKDPSANSGAKLQKSRGRPKQFDPAVDRRIADAIAGGTPAKEVARSFQLTEKQVDRARDRARKNPVNRK